MPNPNPRPIKFRAWLGELKQWADEVEVFGDGSWMTENYVPNTDGLTGRAAKDGDVLMQFTGLLDKNSTPIFEGDRITNGTPFVWEVRFVRGSFVGVHADEKSQPKPTRHVMHLYDNPTDNYSVVGNIFENGDPLPHA